MGKYQCFRRQDWKTGLPLLAQGSEAQWKSAAGKDLAAPSTAADRLQLADLWWRLADTLDEEGQAAVRRHALTWYQAALPDLAGLSRVRVEQRLKQWQDADAAAGPSDESHGETSTAATTATRHAPVSKGATQYSLLEFVGRAVKGQQTVSSKEFGFTLGKQAFSAIPGEGEVLVGLDVSLGTFNTIQALRPIYLASKGRTVLGPVIGVGTTLSTRLRAKVGYAVGAIGVAPGIGLDAVSVTFMKIEGNGLNRQQFYQSPWIGKRAGDSILGGDGSPLVGIFGHRDTQKIMSLGVVSVEKSE